MDKLNFRYTKNIDVTVEKNASTTFIFFKEGNNIKMKFVFRPYFDELIFHYKIFSWDFFDLNKVICTAKDGGSYIARVFENNRFYAIRKKKKKEQILFMEANRLFKNYTLTDKPSDVVCYLNGKTSRDKELIDNFFEKRKSKPFDEQKFIESLDEDEKKDYLESIKIDEVVGKIGKENNLSDEQIEHLSIFIQFLEDNDPIKILVLNSTDYSIISKSILPLINKDNEFNIDKPINPKSDDREYTIDSKYIYSEVDFDTTDFNLSEGDFFIYDLLYYFEYNYEEIKDYYNNSIEKVKKSIDEVLPFFEYYIKQRNT